MDNHLLHTASQLLLDSQRVLLVSHIRPDGDAVGSLLGLGLALQAIGKDAQMVLADGVPKNFRHLPGSNQVHKSAKGLFDLIVVLDCSDLQRVGPILDGYPQPDLNIDHHITNLNFGRINLVDTQAVSTTEILTEHFQVLGLPLTRPVAATFLTGLITDTLGFRTANMTPKALRIAANLMEAGANLYTLYQQALFSRSLQAARYWGSGLATIQLEDRMLWATLTLKDREEANYPGRDDADLINILTTINGVDVALIFVEQKNNKVKVSWRAQPGFDVSKIALQFGGGGHKPAAGAEIEGDIEEVKTKVLAATRSVLNGNTIESILEG
jgi:phosphoesterase RecJ-like protein